MPSAYQHEHGSSYGSFGLSLALLVHSVLPLGAASPASGQKVYVDVMRGQELTHATGRRSRNELQLRVTDQNQKPIQDAVVVLQAPQEGPGGTFADSTRFATVLSDRRGLVTVRGFRANRVQGSFQILVTASYRDFEPVTTSIRQRNSDSRSASESERRGPSRKVLFFAGSVAAGALLVTLVGGGGSGPSATAFPRVRSSNSGPGRGGDGDDD